MPLQWINKNNDKTPDSMSSTCHMAQKFESFKEEAGKDLLNIVTTNSQMAEVLLKAFTKLEDNFPTLQLRFGWINSEGLDVEDLEILFSKSLVVGEDKYIKGYLKVPNVKTLNISSKARTNGKHLGFQRHFAKHNNLPSEGYIGRPPLNNHRCMS